MSRHSASLGATIVRGAIAGAAGTVALDVATYADMALRGRPPSEVPDKVVKRTAEEAHLPLTSDDDTTKNRRSGLSAIMGYATGVAGGIAYALWRRGRREPSGRMTGPALGIAVMAFTDTSSTLAGATDPREWSASAWLSDLVPHLVYGAVTASTFASWSKSQRL